MHYLTYDVMLKLFPYKCCSDADNERKHFKPVPHVHLIAIHGNRTTELVIFALVVSPTTKRSVMSHTEYQEHWLMPGRDIEGTYVFSAVLFSSS